MKKEEKRNSIPEETAAEPLNDESLEMVSKKSDLNDSGRKK